MTDEKPDAEPVAWRYRYPNLSVWSLTQESEIADYALRDCIVEPLYAAPPRPDASAKSRFTLDEIEAAMDRVLERYGFHAAPPDASAGLIEAAEIAEEYARECLGMEAPLHAHALDGFAKVLRARAADRNGLKDQVDNLERRSAW